MAVVLVTGPGTARAQATGGAPLQPPAFAEPAGKLPGEPRPGSGGPVPAEQQPVPPPAQQPPAPQPSLPAGPSVAVPPPAAYPPPPPGYPPPPPPAYPYPYPHPYPYPPPPPVAGSVPSVSASGSPPQPAPPPEPARDPQADRVVLLPTATTHPAGTFYVSNYELVIFQAGYAFTDATQLSLTVIPAPSESLTILDVSLKTSLYRGGLVRAAAIGSVSGAAGKDVGLQLLGRAGGVVQVCTARRCDSSLSLSSNVMLAGALLIMVNGAGGIWRMSEHISVLAELATMVPVGRQGGQFNGAVLGGGVRLHYAHWGFDFSALHVLDSTADVSTLPFLAMTWLP